LLLTCLGLVECPTPRRRRKRRGRKRRRRGVA